MNKYDAGEIRALFERGQNIIEWIAAREGTATNSETAILYSYDAQAGSYVAELKDEGRRRFKDEFGRRLAGVLDALRPVSVLDAGTGIRARMAMVLFDLSAAPLLASAVSARFL